MRVSKSTKAAHRAAILDQAGRLFRRAGIGAVGVADITRAAGLTHGGFYGHFASKSALAAESCRRSLLDSAGTWQVRADRARAAGRDPIGAVIDAYLTKAHRDAPDGGCTLAALGAEAVRDPHLRAALDEGTLALAAVLERQIAADHPGRDAAACARAALGVLAAMNGGLILARAFAGDPERSQAALQGAADLARRAAD
jgi:TetR/AcrR family transcriptional repressor of nem operon